MKKAALILTAVLVFGTNSILFAQDAGNNLRVTESAVCTGISDKMPEGVTTEFSKDITKIYYWTKIEGANEPATVKHVWYQGDTVISEVVLDIKYPSFRTWTNKTIYPGLEGDMAVEVIDASGNVLKRDTFTIK